MRKWIFRAVAIIVLLTVVLTAVLFWSESGSNAVVGHVSNERLPTIRPDFRGTPVDRYGRFVNLEFPFMPSLVDLVKWKGGGNPRAEKKKNDLWRLEVRDPTEFLQSGRDGILWLGHAGFYIRSEGHGILIDPIFGKPPIVDEIVSVPSPLERLERVDYVLTSHDHRDHTDEHTLREIAKKFPDAVFLSGLGSEDLIGDWKTATNPMQTAGWFQQFTMNDGGLRIYFLPVRHWSRRGLLDLNRRLWGGFVIQTDSVTIYFDGDSGYDSHYRQLGELFPRIDYFIIGIGGYEPRWFMEPAHNSPEQAVKAFTDAGARMLVPMHFGRFDLSDEPASEPLRLLNESAARSGISDRIRMLNIYDSIDIPNDAQRP